MIKTKQINCKILKKEDFIKLSKCKPIDTKKKVY